MNTEKAIEVIRLLEVKRKELEKDEKANGHYWNGDSWGSISGFKDAEEWLRESLANYLIEILGEV